MKTFKEFLFEARKYTRTRSREDADKIRQSKENPEQYRLKNRQTKEMPYWGLEPRAKQKGQQQRRAANLKPLSHQEIEDHCKRNMSFSTNCKELAKKAIKAEVARKRAQKREVQQATAETGIEHNVGHIVPQPDKRSEALRARFQAIHPGDTSVNRQVETGKENREKNSKNTNRTRLTRGSAIVAAIKAAQSYLTKAPEQVPETEQGDEK